MKEKLLFILATLALTYLLLSLRRWLVRPQSVLPRLYPVYLLRSEDHEFGSETAETSPGAFRRSIIRIKLPTQIMRYTTNPKNRRPYELKQSNKENTSA
jgi:hypothetical protein